MSDSASDKSDQKLPDWVTRLAESKVGVTVLSALEATILPIPLEAALVPLMVNRPDRAVMLGILAVIGCVAGSLVLYGLGLWLSGPVVEPVLERLGLTQDFEEMKKELEGGSLFVTVALISLSPAPLQLASLGVGVVGGSLPLFLAAVIASRGARYLGLALLAQWFGPKIQDIHIPIWAWLALAALLVIGMTILV